jgi:hypothetical protein
MARECCILSRQLDPEQRRIDWLLLLQSLHRALVQLGHQFIFSLSISGKPKFQALLPIPKSPSGRIVRRFMIILAFILEMSQERPELVLLR